MTRANRSRSNILACSLPAMLACSLACVSARSDGKGSASRRLAEAEAEFLPDGQHMLFLPDGEPQALLGRAVSFAEDGTMVVAPDRAPGCRVSVREVANGFEKDYVQRAGMVVGIRAGIPKFAELSAEYREQLDVMMHIENTSILRADLEGDCGAQVVTEVRVGTGERRVVDERGGSAGLELELAGPTGVAAAGGGSEGEGSRLTWTQPQAWAVSLGDGNRGGDDIRISMPEELTAGDKVEVEVSVGRALWLVVLYRDARGHHDILLPRGSYESFHAADSRTKLPAFDVSNLPGHREDREMLIVFGFTEEADFRQFRPPAGKVAHEEVDRWLTDLEQRLQNREIPAARWTKATFSYVIRARGK